MSRKPTEIALLALRWLVSVHAVVVSGLFLRSAINAEDLDQVAFWPSLISGMGLLSIALWWSSLATLGFLLVWWLLQIPVVAVFSIGSDGGLHFMEWYGAHLGPRLTIFFDWDLSETQFLRLSIHIPAVLGSLLTAGTLVASWTARRRRRAAVT